ncbi:glycosyltransferase [Cucumibacter marinus]|uniref:glycosyltransferase n=1 Tax=Cucumibacter marinus TaxID=1121252 RepID=UPI0004915ABA|nr:glycosyltransferase [Cucumibacter marinus]
MSQQLRIAVVAHGHPDFDVGGAEIAAYNLFTGYREQADVAEAVFLAGMRRPGQSATGLISARREHEFLWNREMHDWHLFRGLGRDEAGHRFRAWLELVNPDIVHAHHYAHLGIEMFELIRRTCPQTRIFLTLHEFQAICKNNGQMVKPGSGRLCSHESIEDCHRCYPDVSREDFWLRKNFIQRNFDWVDGFVAPSEFLRQRYIDWGIAPERITTIENGQIPVAPAPHREPGRDGLRNRFGYFGQLNPFKGIDVLLDALSIAHRQGEAPLHLEVHGANLDLQQPDFITRIEASRDALLPHGCLQWHGPYEPQDLHRRMRGVDWVVIPSIWWENSPMVIQEAFAHRRPVVVSDIGGMAEKAAGATEHTRVEPRNPLALAETMVKLASDPGIWEQNVKRIKPPITVAESAAAHLDWFGQIAARTVA